MPVKQRGFSLTEVLLAMLIGSVLLLSASRFLPALQRAILGLTAQQELEEEVWQRLFALGKQLQRAGYCAGRCSGQALAFGRAGRCVIVQWDVNSNSVWEASPAYSESFGFRLESGALETLRGARTCEGKGWEKLTDPETVLVTAFQVSKTDRPGFAPGLEVMLAATRKGAAGGAFQAHYMVSGYNL